MKTLRRGKSSKYVTMIKEVLKREGFYDGPMDEEFSKELDTAVRSFQRKNRLSADGAVGRKTWRKMGFYWDEMYFFE